MRKGGFRRDIEGLRAVAVLGVVLYHAHVTVLGGGYAGVDVFFVISGFLITGQLWREVEQRGEVRLGAFYGRRARRLLPASMLVLVVTMAASARWLPPLQARSVWLDGLTCALYAGNYRFALARTDYLQATAPPSPFQHYWSLGVEEQFYLVWPLLLLLAAGLVWRRRRTGRAGVHFSTDSSARRRTGTTTGATSMATAVGVLAVVAAASLVLSLVLTRADQPWAFFSLPTRAWELAAGGIVALATPWLRAVPARVAAAAGWVGLGAVVWSLFAFGAATPWPGSAALVPVGGSALLIAAGVGAPAGGPDLVLARRVPRFFGRISYSLYLWHWPALVLAPYVVGHALGVGADLGVAAASVVLAAASYLLVERPAQQWPWLARPGRSLLTGAALSGAGVLSCALAVAALPSTVGHGRAPTAALHPVTVAGPPPARTGGGSTTTVDPLAAQIASLSAQVAAAVASSASTAAVPANLQPPLADAASSQPPPDYDGCLLSYTATTSPTCLFGDTTGSGAIVLFGDSHAAMWFPAVDAYAIVNHDRLYVWTKAVCPPADVSLFSPALGRTYRECDDWRAATIARVQALHPALVVFGTAPNYNASYRIVQDGPQWLAGLTRSIGQVRASGAAVAVLGPAPSPPTVIADCLSAHLDDATACNVPVSAPLVGGLGLDGYDVAGLHAEAAAVAGTGATFVDMEPMFCTATSCPAIVDNLLVYRDGSHITTTYAGYLAPLVGAELTLAAR